MQKYFYPIFKLPDYYIRDYQKQELPLWVKWWLLGKAGRELSEILTGSEFTLLNTVSRKFKIFELSGRTEQEQLSGKNLFSGNYSQFDSTGGQGTTYAYFKLPDENKRYILTMTAKEDFTPTNTTYIGMTRNGGNADGAYQWLIDGNYGQTIVKGRTISLYSNVNSKNLQFVSLFSKSSETLKKFTDKFDIQLEEGDTSTSYEPYCRTEYQHQIQTFQYQ